MLQNYEIYHNEVFKTLEKRRSSPNAVAHVYKTDLNMLWIPTPEQRKIAKKGFSFSHLSFSQLHKIWFAIWQHSDVLEVKSQALLFYDSIKRHEGFARFFPHLKKYAEGLENWVHSDILSDFIARMLEERAEKVLPTLEKWNRCKNPWKRRQSVVSLFYYQRQRRSYPSFTTTEKLLRPLLKDDHHYVQKGVGWTLREVYQVYPKKTQQFLKDHLEELSPIAFTTVGEKLESNLKKEFKARRKKARASLSKC